MWTISLTPTRTATVTPTSGTIIPVNPYVPAFSLLQRKTAAALREISVPQELEDAPMELTTNSTAATIGGQAIVISALKVLLNQGVVEPLRQFRV
jgi:hypothetical protein